MPWDLIAERRGGNLVILVVPPSPLCSQKSQQHQPAMTMIPSRSQVFQEPCHGSVFPLEADRIEVHILDITNLSVPAGPRRDEGTCRVPSRRRGPEPAGR